MPVDPSIALAGRPAQITPVSDLMSTAIRNREGMQQILLNKQREDLYNEEARQRQIANDLSLKTQARIHADQDLVQKAHQKNPGNWGAIRQEVAGQIRPEYLQQLDKSNLEVENAQRAKSTADHLAMKDKAEAIGGETEALMKYKDGDPNLPAAYKLSRQHLIDQGYIKPEDVPEEYPGRQFLQDMNTRARGAAYLSKVEVQKREDAAKQVQETIARGTQLKNDLGLIGQIVQGIDPTAEDAQSQLDDLREQFKDSPALNYIPKKASKDALAAAIKRGITVEKAVSEVPKPPGPQVSSRVNAITGDVTPTVVTIGADGKPIITTGAPAKGIAATRPPAGVNQDPFGIFGGHASPQAAGAAKTSVPVRFDDGTPGGKLVMYATQDAADAAIRAWTAQGGKTK